MPINQNLTLEVTVTTRLPFAWRHNTCGHLNDGPFTPGHLEESFCNGCDTTARAGDATFYLLAELD